MRQRAASRPIAQAHASRRSAGTGVPRPHRPRRSPSRWRPVSRRAAGPARPARRRRRPASHRAGSPGRPQREVHAPVVVAAQRAPVCPRVVAAAHRERDLVVSLQAIDGDAAHPSTLALQGPPALGQHDLPERRRRRPAALARSPTRAPSVPDGAQGSKGAWTWVLQPDVRLAVCRARLACREIRRRRDRAKAWRDRSCAPSVAHGRTGTPLSTGRGQG